MKRKKKLVIVLAAMVGVGLVVTSLVLMGILALPTTLYCLGVSGASRTFTIIADLSGFNNSRNTVGLGVGPIMNVSRCDHVTISLVNADTQAHGLAVGGLATPGIIVPVGETLSLSFLAYKTGHWRVYCTVTSCSVHENMQNAQLNVT